MAFWNGSFHLRNELSHRTDFFGLRLWVLVAISVGVVIVLALFLLAICLAYRRRRPLPSSSHRTLKHLLRDSNTPISKEILDIFRHHSPPRAAAAAVQNAASLPVAEVRVDIGNANDHIVLSEQKPQLPLPSSLIASNESPSTVVDVTLSPKGIGGLPEVSHLGWGHWYTLRELEEATGGFVDENVIGEGGYGIVYRGVLPDNTMVAIKNLFNNRGQAEKEFRVEVEAIGRVRHKNLVRLLGFCVEGAHRYVAPEYASTGMLNERSDVYSFGVLMLEIISGRIPVDYSRPPGEVNLVEWLKNLIRERRAEEILDPKILEKPSSKALKRALLVALRCVDPNALERPRMGHVIHMLET